MKATNLDIGKNFNVRLRGYKSIRHYGGNEITTYEHIVDATLVALQNGFQRYVVVLNSDTQGYKKGHKIAVCEKDFMILN